MAEMDEFKERLEFEKRLANEQSLNLTGRATTPEREEEKERVKRQKILRDAGMPSTLEQGMQKQMQEETSGLDRALAGAGKAAYESTIGPARALGGFVTGGMEGAREQMGKTRDIVEPLEKTMKGDIPFKVGELATDVALSAYPGAKLSQVGKLGRMVRSGSKPMQALKAGGIEGLGSAGIHQAQDIGRGEGFSGKEAALEAGLSSLIPGAGSLAGAVAKKLAPSVLRKAVRPSGELIEQIKPKQLDEALERGDVPYFGGVGKLAENLGERLFDLTKKRSAMAKEAAESGQAADAGTALSEVYQKFNKMLEEGRIDLEDYKGAMEALQKTRKGFDKSWRR